MSPTRAHAKVLFAFLVSLSLLFTFHTSARALPISQAKRHILPNGLRFVLKEIHAAPFVSIQVWILAGSANEDKYTGTGISHFVEHMLFKGTHRYGVGEIERKIKSLGGQISAFTSHDYIACKISIPKENFKEVLLVLADILSNATFVEEEFKKERDVILSEIRMGDDDPQRRINKLLYKSAYSHHPYRYPVIGEKERFEALTRDDLLEFYRENFVPHKIVLVVVGDIDSNSADDSINEIFSKIPPSRISQAQRILEPRQLGLRKASEIYDTKPALLLLGYHSVSISEEDLYPLDLLASILGDGDTSRLNKTLKQKERLVYSIGAYNYTPRDPGLFIIHASLEAENIERVIREAHREIEIIKDKPPSRAELDIAKKRIKTDILLNLSTIDNQAQDMGLNELLVSDPDFTDFYLENLDRVKPEDLSRVANIYLKNDNSTIATIVPKESKAQPEIAQAPPVTSPIQKFTLKNGVKVLIRENHDLPLISICASFYGGLRVETDRINGISNLTARALLKGTKSKSAQDIARIVDSLGGNIYTDSGNNSFSIAMDLLSQDLNTGLSLLRELLTEVSFPEDEIEREKDIIISQIKREDKDIFHASGNLLKKTLYAKHPFKLPQTGSERSVKNIERKDILEFYRRFYTPSNMVLAIFGDVETKKVLESLKILESISKRKFDLPELEEEVALKAPREAELHMEKEQALLLVGFLGIDIKDDDRHAFDVLTSILSRGGGQVYSKIRDEMGLAYILGSYQVLGLERGYYTFYVATVRDKIALVKERLFGIIESLKEIGPTDEELQNAKAELVSSHKLEHETNAGFARAVTLDELYSLGYDNYKYYDAKVNAVTAEDLRRVAKKYFDLNTAVIVTTLPSRYNQ